LLGTNPREIDALIIRGRNNSSIFVKTKYHDFN
jgi:hypothetical protein